MCNECIHNVHILYVYIYGDQIVYNMNYKKCIPNFYPYIYKDSNLMQIVYINHLTFNQFYRIILSFNASSHKIRVYRGVYLYSIKTSKMAHNQ